MDMYKLKFTKLQNEIFRLLCIKAGNSLNQREIAKLLKVSPTAVSKALPLLGKEGVVKIEKMKSMNLKAIELNRDDERAIDFKRVENLKMIYESGIVKLLEDSFLGAAIILFGSYSRGDDVASSDIDIAVIGCKEKEKELDKFEKLFEREIIINFYDNWKEIHKNLRDNILNGIVFSGSVDL